jgi:hypothetical protein
VEFNWVYHTNGVSDELVTRLGDIGWGDFSTTGNLVTLAAGANAVLIPAKLEVGMVYTTEIAAQRDFSFDGFLFRMTLRY